MCALEAAAAKKAQENRIKSGIAEVERIAKSLRITDGIVFKITITGMPHFFPAVADLPQLADIVVMNVKQTGKSGSSTTRRLKKMQLGFRREEMIVAVRRHPCTMDAQKKELSALIVTRKRCRFVQHCYELLHHKSIRMACTQRVWAQCSAALLRVMINRQLREAHLESGPLYRGARHSHF